MGGLHRVRTSRQGFTLLAEEGSGRLPTDALPSGLRDCSPLEERKCEGPSVTTGARVPRVDWWGPASVPFQGKRHVAFAFFWRVGDALR